MVPWLSSTNQNAIAGSHNKGLSFTVALQMLIGTAMPNEAHGRVAGSAKG